MNEVEFLTLWGAEKATYQLWGEIVRDTIHAELTTRLGTAHVGEFLKIQPVPRVKEDGSLVDKAFYRGKGYSDPYKQIEDKVGLRFVVLLTTDISVISKIIEGCPNWQCSRDKDFEADQARAPEVFGYQSVHYVVRPNVDIRHGNEIIPAGMPCEVQLRTLLQHAHSELTHDTIYKPKTTASSRAKRYCARSMALIETTDDFFLEVVKEIRKAGEPLEQAMQNLRDAYRSAVGREAEPTRLNTLILDAFDDVLEPDLSNQIAAFLSRNTFVANIVSQRAADKLLFRQPAILLVYFRADGWASDTKDRWPLTPDELRLIYNDLGRSFDA